MTDHRGWLLAGLSSCTLATLVLENLNARLLSVLTWYHLSFFAVSLAMLGMAAGGVAVFLRADLFAGQRARRLLARFGLAFAASVPLSHAAILRVPIPVLDILSLGPVQVGWIAAAAAVLAVPFLLSGVVVTVALTRVGGSIGWLYAADLFGAAAGCLAVVPLLNHLDITSAAAAAGAVAAAGAFSLYRFSGRRGAMAAVTTLLLVVGAALNDPPDRGLGIRRAKGVDLPLGSIQLSAWSTHAHVLVLRPSPGPAFFWGGGEGAEKFTANTAAMLVDGAAATVITEWDGSVASLGWVEHDVTHLPYHLRSGKVAVIGVGGGRDILSAVRAGSRSITGIEINGVFLRILSGSHRRFAGIADRPEVALVHDEGRSFLAGADQKFDVVQMSLIDTWAATGAGAFTLSENGLYTVEAWRLLLRVLEPSGILAVSRWYSPERISETNRLLSLAVAALLDRGVTAPANHIVLVAHKRVATLLLSPDPFLPSDLERVEDVTRRYGFTLLVAPKRPAASPRMQAMVASGSLSELERAAADPYLDYRPPTDRRPYFFNLLKPGGILKVSRDAQVTGVVAGNLNATATLAVLLLVAVLLVLAIITLPLARSGLPSMGWGALALSILYFSQIGFGFMFVQLALLQRFTVLLGHPTYSLAIILFAMILFAGLGSLLSDAVDLSGRWLVAVPLGIGAAVLFLAVSLQPLIDSTFHLSLVVRGTAVVATTAPVSMLLGFCFPFGVRLVDRLAHDATAWMWGVNGACSVLGSIIAVAVSMWSGIDTNLIVAAVLYAGLALTGLGLVRLTPSAVG